MAPQKMDTGKLSRIMTDFFAKELPGSLRGLPQEGSRTGVMKNGCTVQDGQVSDSDAG